MRKSVNIEEYELVNNAYTPIAYRQVEKISSKIYLE